MPYWSIYSTEILAHRPCGDCHRLNWRTYLTVGFVPLFNPCQHKTFHIWTPEVPESIFVVPQESLIVRCWCTERAVKGIEPTSARREKHHNSRSKTHGLGGAPLYPRTYSWGFGVCSQRRLMHALCCKNSLGFLIVTEHNIWQEKWFSPNCSRELTKNFKLKGTETLFSPQVPSHGQNKGEKPSQRMQWFCTCGLVLWCNQKLHALKTWNLYGYTHVDL